jgi:hypothetical protein
MPESTCSSSIFVFLPVFPSYGGISSPVPVSNISKIDLAIVTTNAACNQLLRSSKNKDDQLHPYMAAGKPAATNILISDNVQDLLVHTTILINKHNDISHVSLFPRFSTPYGGICSPVPALLTAETPPGSVSSCATNKIANLVTTNPMVVPNDINTTSKKI